MKRIFFAVAACIMGSPLLAQSTAQPSNAADSISTKSRELDLVTVTANKYPRKQSETGKLVTIISSEQLLQNSGRNIAEVLQDLAGVSINGANNTLGSVNTINLRGSAAGNTLLLIDGVPVNDPSVNSNYFDLNLLQPDDVERIEVLRGGQSTLYGSDAVAGVINIITRKPGKKALQGMGGLSMGSYATLKADAGINGTKDKFQYKLHYSYAHSDGFSSAYDSSGNKHFDRDGYNQNGITSLLGYQINDHLNAQIHFQYNRYHNDVDAGAFTDDKDYTVVNRNTQAGFGLNFKKKNWDLHLKYQYNSLLRSYLNDSTDRSDPNFYYSRSRYTAGTHFADLYGSIKGGIAEWLLGIDFRRHSSDQDYFSYSIYGPYETNLKASLAHISQWSPYSSLIIHPKGSFALEMGARMNHHSVYGNNFTYNVNPYYWLLPERIKLFANLYSAYKIPTLYQLFDPFAGNQDLAPEKALVYEAGLHFYAGEHFHLSADYFRRRTNNAIEYIITDPNTYSSQYRNISRINNHGWELNLSESWKKWQLNLNYAFTKGSTHSPYDATGNKLPQDTSYNSLYRVPEHALHVNLGLQLTTSLYLGARFRYLSERLEAIYGAVPVPLSDYGTIDFQTRYTFSKAWAVFANLQNITNRKYFDNLGYNARGFNGTIGIQFNAR